MADSGPVSDLIGRSNRLGSDPRNTNYAGGNTSAKGTATDPVTGRPVELLWVKGSGGDLGTLTEAGLAVLRLTQEALTNVAKHAGPAARARLRVAVEEDTVIWEVTDDGGAAPVPATPGGGHGLTGMRERIDALGGSLSRSARWLR